MLNFWDLVALQEVIDDFEEVVVTEGARSISLHPLMIEERLLLCLLGGKSSELLELIHYLSFRI
jgi:hypothetical protein